MKIIVSVPSEPEFVDVKTTVLSAIQQASQSSGEQLEQFIAQGNAYEVCDDVVASGKDSLVVVDISSLKEGCMYMLGYADALLIPRLLISSGVGYPNTLHYERTMLTALQKNLSQQIVEAFNEPSKFVRRSSNQQKPNNVRTAFISYSHVDRECLNRLRVHLKPLEREDLIQVWDDTQIKAGDHWKRNIEKALDTAAIAVLLISPDFLASDFIIANELPPLLAGASRRGTRVMPLILRPCRFSRDKNLSQFQAINSPSSPLLKLTNVEQDELYEQVAAQIEAYVRASN